MPQVKRKRVIGNDTIARGLPGMRLGLQGGPKGLKALLAGRYSSLHGDVS
jgi:hypothetical protein